MMRLKNPALFLSLLICCLVFLLYYPTRHFEFLNFDDNQYISDNSHVNSGLSWQNIKWAFVSQHGAHWHPLAWISHMLDVELFGLSPGPHHLANAALHSFNALLLFLFILQGSGALAASFFAALLFGLHPLRLESVAWVTERKDVLSMFFMLSSLLAYQTYVKSSSRLFYLTALASFFLSLLSKPSAVVLPFLLLLVDFWPLGRLKFSRSDFKLRQLLIEKIPFFLGAIVCAGLTIAAQSAGGGLKSLEAYPLQARLASSLVGYLAYLGKFFIPTGFGIFYPFAEYQPGVAAGAFISLLVISLWVFSRRSSEPYLLSGWLWFLIALLPVIGIVQIGGQAFADRWSYLAHIGLIFAATFWGRDLFKKDKTIKICLSSALILMAACITWRELPNWKDSESIFRHTIAVSPDNFMAHMNLGVALDRRGNLDEAMKHYDRAVLIKPFYPDALNNLAGARARVGDLLNAEHFLKRALGQSPNFVPALYNLGLVYVQGGRVLQGVLHFVRALKLDLKYMQAAQALENVLGRFEAGGCAIINRSQQEQIAAAQLASELNGLDRPDLEGKLSLLAACY